MIYSRVLFTWDIESSESLRHIKILKILLLIINKNFNLNVINNLAQKKI